MADHLATKLRLRGRRLVTQLGEENHSSWPTAYGRWRFLRRRARLLAMVGWSILVTVLALISWTVAR